MRAEVVRETVRGVRYCLRLWGEGPALLLLHGFTGSGATWTPFRSSWPGFRCIAPDLLGHGETECPSDAGRYDMSEAVEDILVLMDRFSAPRAALIGYSMGGRLALHMALAAGERFWALVLESASPGIEDPVERERRRQRDEALARAIERHGVAAFVAQWESQPLFATQAKLPATVRHSLRRQRLRNRAEGLANSLRGMGAGAQRPLWGRLREISTPALVLAGEHDEKCRAMAQRTAELLPAGRARVVPGAGHAIHLERPAVFAQVVGSFLRECLPLDEKEEVAPCP